MSALPSAHLTADDLDAFLVDAASPVALQHVAFCDVCRATVQADRILVASLHGLPTLAPTGGFAERVMAQVRIASPAPAMAALPWPRRVLANRRLVASVAIAGGAWGSAVWTVSNGDLFDQWTQQAWQLGSTWTLQTLQALAGMVAQQPWYGALESMAASPARAALVVTAVVTTWAIGLLALKRLVMLPSEPAADAGW